MTAECTLDHCQEPAILYLCGRCTRDLAAIIESARTMLPDLDPVIARQATTKPPAATGAGGVDPGINFTALQLKFNIETMLNAEDVARAPDARDVDAMYRWIEQQAELAISGPRAEHVDHDLNRERIRNAAPPMITRQLVPWLRENAGITITATDVNNWAKRGKLHRFLEDGKHPAYLPHEVLAAWNETRPASGF